MYKILSTLVFSTLFVLSCSGNPVQKDEVPAVSVPAPQADNFESLARVKMGDKWGYINQKGEMIVKPQFDLAEDFSEGLACVAWGDEWGYVNQKGEKTVTFSSPGKQFGLKTKKFSQGVSPVIVGTRWGYINEEGKMVIQPQFDDARDFSGDLARTKIAGKWGYINLEGAFVIDPQFEEQEIGRFSEGLARVKMGDKWGYINREGKMIIQPQFDDAGYFSGDLARVKIGDKAGLVNRKGEVFIGQWTSWTTLDVGKEPVLTGPPSLRSLLNVADVTPYPDIFIISSEFNNVGNFSEGLARVRTSGNWYYINREGKQVSSRFEFAGDFFEGLARVRSDDGKWGYIDLEFQPVIDPKFDDAGNFSEGLARVKSGYKWGYINRTGEMVVEPQYIFADDFSEGLARVIDDDYWWTFIDQKGERSFNAGLVKNVDYMGSFFEGLARVKKKGRKYNYFTRKSPGESWSGELWGTDSSGIAGAFPVVVDSLIKNFRYYSFDDAGDFSDGLVRVKIDGKWGYINRAGEMIIEPLFDDAGDFSDGLARIKKGDKWGYIDKEGKIAIEPQYNDARNFRK